MFIVLNSQKRKRDKSAHKKEIFDAESGFDLHFYETWGSVNFIVITKYRKTGRPLFKIINNTLQK